MDCDLNRLVGERIAKGRRRRGWYQKDLALAIGRSESLVSQVERGIIPLDSLELAESIATALRLDVKYVLALDVRCSALQKQTAPTPLAASDPAEANWMSMLRRMFVASAGGVLADAALGTSWIGALGASGSSRPMVDPSTLDDMRTVGSVYRSSYRAVPSEALLPLAIGQIRLAFSLEPADQPEPVRMVLLRHVGEMAALAGAVQTLDLGDFEAADPLLSLAATAGKRIGDQELIAVAYGCRAFHAGYGGGREGVEEGLDWAQAAQDIAHAGASPRTVAWVCAVASEMHASLKDDDAAFRALEEARRALQRPAQDDRWAGIGWLDEAKLDAYEGGDLVRLGHHTQAVERLTAALDGLSPSMARHRATALVDRADALVASGEAEAACKDAGEALETVARVHQAETLRRITTVARAVRGHQSPAARALREHLLDVRAALPKARERAVGTASRRGARA